MYEKIPKMYEKIPKMYEKIPKMYEKIPKMNGKTEKGQDIEILTFCGTAAREQSTSLINDIN